jgi:purine-nucleoside phosphorylase
VTDPISYDTIPGFKTTTVQGHEGKLFLGHIEDVPVVGFKGRRHYYEIGDEPNNVVALKEITFPVYVAKALGTSIYFATNASGGLNTSYKICDLMAIESHIDIFFPNPLLGSQVDFMEPMRFQPQNGQYNIKFRQLLKKAAINVNEQDCLKEGVYCVLTGPTFESRADCQALRKLGADAVGMSTVPEIITASNLKMETIGLSLVTNIIAEDGTNATSHEEVMAALENPTTMERVRKIIMEFFRLFKEIQDNNT